MERPQAPFLHGLADDGLHVGDFGGRGGPLIPADAPDADGGVAQDVGHVDGDGIVVFAEEVGDGEPVGGHGRVAVEAGVEPDVAVQVFLGFERSVGYAVDADEFGGDALADLGIVVRLAEDGEAGVGVEVDEAGAHDVSGGVDDTGRRRGGGRRRRRDGWRWCRR